MDLEPFRTWLLERGRAPNTAELYVIHVRTALRGEDPAKRLIDRSLAPKTRRSVRASLRAWAVFAEDSKLLLRLQGIKMPSPARITQKKPLSIDEWVELRRAIDESGAPEAVKIVLGLMAARGFRCGDVLRLERRPVETALRSGELVFEAKGERWVRFKVGRWRPMLDALIEHPRRWKRVEELIVQDAVSETQRRKLAWQTCSRWLKRIAASIGLEPKDLHTHRLRRTYAVHYLNEMQGDPQALQKLQQQMQWASSQTLFGYTDYVPLEELDAVDDRLSERLEDHEDR